jgi:hypothetical protein
MIKNKNSKNQEPIHTDMLYKDYDNSLKLNQNKL